MKVKVLANKRDASLRLAFIQMETKNFGSVSVPAYFPKGMSEDQLPKDGQEVDVMITGILFKNADASHFDGLVNGIKCLFIREPTKEDIKVRLEGFETWGSQCFTDSRASNGKQTFQTVTPGRLMPYLHNSYTHDFYTDHDEIVPKYPFIGYIRKNPENGKMRLEGIDDVKDFNL